MSSEQSVTESPVQPSAPQATREDSSELGNSGSGAYEGGYELDESGQRVPHGMGQSKSSRRRRRKRKGKGSEAGAPGAAFEQNTTDEADAAPSATISVMAGEAPAPGNPPMRSSSGQSQPQGRTFSGSQAGGGAPGQANGSGGQLNGAPGTKRWKKKFRDRDRPRPAGESSHASSAQGSTSQASSGPSSFRGPDTHQPGNSSGFKRKGGFSSGGGKQRSSGGGSRGGFVGPMDHSYRAANGNVFETSPATIDPYGNGNGHSGGRSRSYHQSDSQPIDYSQGRAIPIAADAPTKIYFFIEDLFFIAKISETARKLGVKVAFAKNEKEQIAALTDATEDERPGLIVFDLNNANAKPMSLIPKLKTKLKKTTSIIGFLSHLQGDLKAKAVEAGCDTVMPRAAFSQNLPNLLRRYGIEDVEETNYNQ